MPSARPVARAYTSSIRENGRRAPLRPNTRGRGGPLVVSNSLAPLVTNILLPVVFRSVPLCGPEGIPDGMYRNPGIECEEVYRAGARPEDRVKASVQGRILAAPPHVLASQGRGWNSQWGEEPLSEWLDSSAADAVRAKLTEEEMARTKEFVDAAWQSLE